MAGPQADDVADPAACAEGSSDVRPPGGGGGGGGVLPDDARGPALARAGVAAIDYDARSSRALARVLELRASGVGGEAARRAAGEGIRECKGDFTSWTLRMRAVRELVAAEEEGEGDGEGGVLEEEEAFVSGVLGGGSKNYQVWEYRRGLAGLRVARGEDVARVRAREVTVADAAIAKDGKNYHAWAHRVWVGRGGLGEGGKDVAKDRAFVLGRGAVDVRNNSVYAALWALGVEDSDGDWAMDCVRLAPRNEAAWNFLSAMVQRVGAALAGKAADLARETLSITPENVPARRFLVVTDPGTDVERKLAHCRLLACELDTERAVYWLWKAKQIEDAAE